MSNLSFTEIAKRGIGGKLTALHTRDLSRGYLALLVEHEQTQRELERYRRMLAKPAPPHPKRDAIAEVLGKYPKATIREVQAHILPMVGKVSRNAVHYHMTLLRAAEAIATNDEPTRAT